MLHWPPIINLDHLRSLHGDHPLAGSPTLVVDTKSLFCGCWGCSGRITVLLKLEAYQFGSFHHYCRINQYLWSCRCALHSCRFHLDRKRVVISYMLIRKRSGQRFIIILVVRISFSTSKDCMILKFLVLVYWVNLILLRLFSNFRVVVMSEGHPPDVLTRMNSVLRRIDLTCKLFAPVVTGFIISFVSLKASAMTLAIWNTVSVWLQYWLLMSVYNGIPALRESNQKRTSKIAERSAGESTSACQGVNSSPLADNSWKRKMIKCVWKVLCISAWNVYLRQDVVLSGVALALLYFTVLRWLSLVSIAFLNE